MTSNSMTPAQHEPCLTQCSQTHLCKGCELPIANVSLPRGKRAYCPRCGTRLYHGGRVSLSGNLALAITCLVLFVPSHIFNFIEIRLLGVMIPATLPSGVFTLIDEGFPLLAILILFCSSIAPLAICTAVITAQLSLKLHWFKGLKTSLWIIHHLKQWAMVDVFLVSVAISCFKLQDYSDIHIRPALIALILLQIFTVMLLSRVNIRCYWERWQRESEFVFTKKEMHCDHCHLCQPSNKKCIRCHHTLVARKPYSVQKTWAYLIAAFIAIFPANLIPISVLMTNGQRLEDTIFSGVAGLVKSGMYGIAAIIFVASIVVPVAKILGLVYILICLKLNRQLYQRQRMLVYFMVKWIGKWSMMDLFVISIMMTLIDHGQILDFTPGYGAVAFGVVVILTMLAAENIDPRLIWDTQPNAVPNEKK